MSQQAPQPGQHLAAVLRARGIEIPDDEAARLCTGLLDLIAAGVIVPELPPAAGHRPPVPPTGARGVWAGAGGSGSHAYNVGPSPYMESRDDS